MYIHIRKLLKTYVNYIGGKKLTPSKHIVRKADDIRYTRSSRKITCISRTIPLPYLCIKCMKNTVDTYSTYIRVRGTYIIMVAQMYMYIVYT